MDDPEQVVERCRELALISEEEGRLTRWFAGPAMAGANALVGRWMAEAGMAVRTDAAGNLVGHLPGSDPGAGTLLLGSHLDTVRDAGAFDGPLGVLAAIACVARLRARELSLPFAVDVLKGSATRKGCATAPDIWAAGRSPAPSRRRCSTWSTTTASRCVMR